MRTRSRKNRFDIFSPAKINLFLELPAKRADGFHEIETLMVPVSLADQISFRLREDSLFRLEVHQQDSRETDEIPVDDRNLIIRALKLLKENVIKHEPSRELPGFSIDADKVIPSAAGLGGASSNAAAALLAANQLWDLNWPTEKLSKIAAEIGSDVPFFLHRGAAVCRGRGEKIETIGIPVGMGLVIAKPPKPLSTAQVFANVSISPDLKHCQPLVSCLAGGNWRRLRETMFNRLEGFAEDMTRQIGQLRRAFDGLGTCIAHQMSGSGSSYFGLFPNARLARRAARSLSARHPEVRIFCSQMLSNI